MPDKSTDEILQSWSTTPKQVAQQLIQKYGTPTEGSMQMLRWDNAHPFKTVVVRNEEVMHSIPSPHTESLEFTTEYKVPPEKLSDLSEFNGSILVDKTKGTITVRSQNEQMALLELNLAGQLLEGKLPLEQATQTLQQEAQKIQQGQNSLFAQQLQIKPLQGAAEPGSAPIAEQLKAEVQEIGEKIQELGEKIKQSMS